MAERLPCMGQSEERIGFDSVPKFRPVIVFFKF